MAGIKKWWGGQSKTAKTLYIVGTLAVIAGVVYFATRKKGKDTSNKNDGGVTDIPKEEGIKTPEASSSKTTSSTGTPEKKPQQNTFSDKSSLPNGGVGCGDVKTTYDRDFDYVKCNGVWFTKSKPNAASPYARGLYKEWKSLATNQVASERLNRRYPNG